MYSPDSCNSNSLSLSPFCTPGQFVFLVALITSVLTLIGIASQIRDRSNGLRKEMDAQKSSNNDNLLTSYNHALTMIWVLNQIIGTQLILMSQALIRILVTSFKMELFSKAVYDDFLVFEAFLIFGVIWPIFFAISTSGKTRYKRCIDYLTIKRQQKKPLPKDKYKQCKKTGEKLNVEDKNIEEEDKDFGWVVTYFDKIIICLACCIFSKDLFCKKRHKVTITKP